MATKKQLWYLNSGYSKHVIGDASKLMNIHWKHGGFFTYGDNNRGRILGNGDIGEKGSLIIKDVLLVKGLKYNLLSIN